MLNIIKRLFCEHKLELWSYIGERYVFNCPKCNYFLHIDNNQKHHDM